MALKKHLGYSGLAWPNTNPNNPNVCSIKVNHPWLIWMINCKLQLLRFRETIASRLTQDSWKKHIAKKTQYTTRIDTAQQRLNANLSICLKSFPLHLGFKAQESCMTDYVLNVSRFTGHCRKVAILQTKGNSIETMATVNLGVIINVATGVSLINIRLLPSSTSDNIRFLR